jgi:hypothetical protein
VGRQVTQDAQLGGGHRDRLRALGRREGLELRQRLVEPALERDGPPRVPDHAGRLVELHASKARIAEPQRRARQQDVHLGLVPRGEVGQRRLQACRVLQVGLRLLDPPPVCARHGGDR